VLSVPEALANPQIKHRELLQTFDDAPGVGRAVTVTRAGFKMSSGDPSVSAPPPRLGEHTDELLKGLGYSGAEIAALRSVGAV